jgi:hypothetical protein
MVKGGDIYEQLRLAYKAEQIQIKDIIIGEESLMGSIDRSSEPVYIHDPENPYFRPIVRTTDTTLLEFLSFCNMLGLVKCPDIVKI